MGNSHYSEDAKEGLWLWVTHARVGTTSRTAALAAHCVKDSPNVWQPADKSCQSRGIPKLEEVNGGSQGRTDRNKEQ